MVQDTETIWRISRSQLCGDSSGMVPTCTNSLPVVAGEEMLLLTIYLIC